jgi:N-sulfoglucosamine sulfohydrolase
VLHRQGKLTPEQAAFMAPAKPKEELYDLQQDPHELHNLAADPKLRKTLREHAKVLEEWIEATGDRGQTPEDPTVVAYWQDDMAKSYMEQMEKRGLSPKISDEDYLAWWQQKLLGEDAAGMIDGSPAQG